MTPQPIASIADGTGRTVHGFRRFRCRACGRRFNERTGTVLNRVQMPTDIVFLVVLWRLRYKPSLRDLAQMSLVRGLTFTREAVRDSDRSCRAHDQVRNFLRPITCPGEAVSPGRRRAIHLRRLAALRDLPSAA